MCAKRSSGPAGCQGHPKGGHRHQGGNSGFKKRARQREEERRRRQEPGYAPRYGLMCSDEAGEIWDDEVLVGAARSGNNVRLPRPEELSPLPEGAMLQFLPQHQPLGWFPELGAEREPVAVEGCCAVACQLPSGWTRTLLPAWKRLEGAPDLPIFGYTAVFHRDGELWCAAVQTENNRRWNPAYYALPSLGQRISRLKERLPANRIVRQLEICACEYGCYNAQNIFHGRWEGAVPVSPVCNAGCRGCISKQPEGLPPSPQIRLNFVPTVEEVVELGLIHLANPETIFTFGQGCEGEPLVQGDLIAEAVRRLRAQTANGTLHVNTNGSLTEKAVKVFEAGLNSVRVSLNSVLPATYTAYYQPRGYKFEDVVRTIDEARSRGVWVSLNLLTLPGLTDMENEVEALIRFVNAHDVNMVQMRNLNMDPDLLLPLLPAPAGPSLGIPEMLRRMRAGAPNLVIGNHNPCVNSPKSEQ